MINYQIIDNYQIIFLIIFLNITVTIYLQNKNRSLRLGVRTPGFHPGNRGSIPLGTATFKTHLVMGFFMQLFGIIINYKTYNYILNISL